MLLTAPCLDESELRMDQAYPAIRQEGEETIPCDVILREFPEDGQSYLIEYEGRKYPADFDKEGFYFRY